MTLHLPQIPHIGQVRAAVCLDVMIRWLLASAAEPPDIHGSQGQPEPDSQLAFGPVVPAVPVTQALSTARPQELRYYLLAGAHYSQPLTYTERAADDAATCYRQIERFVDRAGAMLISAYAPAQRAAPSPPPRRPAQPPLLLDLPLSFIAALDDDLSIPAALASVHATVHDGNYAISSGDRDAVAASLAQVRSMLGVLGLDPLDPHWAAGRPGGRPDSADPRNRVIDALVKLALRQREVARGRGDYASADSISDILEGTGIAVMETAAGPQWELKR
jgi:cysteinyl-tRNA synthetase